MFDRVLNKPQKIFRNLIITGSFEIILNEKTIVHSISCVKSAVGKWCISNIVSVICNSKYSSWRKTSKLNFEILFEKACVLGTSFLSFFTKFTTFCCKLLPSALAKLFFAKFPILNYVIYKSKKIVPNSFIL